MKLIATPAIAPSYPMSAADKAAHLAACGGVRRLHDSNDDGGWFPSAADPGDSDPDMDEALRRATTEVTYLQQEQDIRDQVEAAYAEYNDQPKAEYHSYVKAAAA